MKEDKERILRYLLQLIDRDEADYAKKTVKAFAASTSTVYSYVTQLVKAGRLERDAKKASGLALPTRQFCFIYRTADKLSEDLIFQRDIEPLLVDLPRNVYNVWYYCFTEMMNNAIEHSAAKEIQCLVETNEIKTRISIMDDGIGIFHNIHNYLLETTGEDVPERECAGYLLAGRFTTAKERHSGEGVFFTSHMLDDFLIYSSGIAFTRNAFTDKQYDFSEKQQKELEMGTIVLMALSNRSPKEPAEIFDRFSDADNGFYKTEIPMAHLFPNRYPVSRSEARRLFEMIRKFREVTLDFTNIEMVGQAFVHEFFLILAPQTPEQKITLQNVPPRVSATIARVKNTV